MGKVSFCEAILLLALVSRSEQLVPNRVLVDLPEDRLESWLGDHPRASDKFRVLELELSKHRKSISKLANPLPNIGVFLDL